MTNHDATSGNVWLQNSELGLAGRPLSDDRIVAPLSRQLILPESLNAEDDLKIAERQRPSPETTVAQKGEQRWTVLLRSLLAFTGYEMKGKAVLIINFTGYVEELGCAVSLPSFVNEFEMFVVCRLDQTFEML